MASTIKKIQTTGHKNHLQVEGLPRGACEEDISQAYRQLSLVIDPDKCDVDRAAQAMTRLNVAHFALAKRKQPKEAAVRKQRMNEVKRQCAAEMKAWRAAKEEKNCYTGWGTARSTCS